MSILITLELHAPHSQKSLSNSADPFLCFESEVGQYRKTGICFASLLYATFQETHNSKIKCIRDYNTYWHFRSNINNKKFLETMPSTMTIILNLNPLYPPFLCSVMFHMQTITFLSSLFRTPDEITDWEDIKTSLARENGKFHRTSHTYIWTRCVKNLTWGFRDYFEQNSRKFLYNMQYTHTHLKDQKNSTSIPLLSNGLQLIFRNHLITVWLLYRMVWGSHTLARRNREKAAEPRNVFK